MAGYKLFGIEEALAADLNSYLMSQTVPRFATAAARTAALTAPVLGQLSMLDNRPGILQYWTGSAWVDTTPFIRNFQGNPALTVAPNANNAAVISTFTAPYSGTMFLHGIVTLSVSGAAGGNQYIVSIGPTSAPAPAGGVAANLNLVSGVTTIPIYAAWAAGTVTAGMAVSVALRLEVLGGPSSGTITFDAGNVTLAAG